MKKLIAKTTLLALVLTLALGVLAACGGGDDAKSEFVGTWKATKITYTGVEMEPSEAGLEFTVEIKEDGTLTATTNGEDDGAGEWEEKDGTIHITDGTGAEMDGTLEDGVMVIDFGDEFIVTMEKE